MVHTHHIHGRIRRWRSYDHALGTSLQMAGSALNGRENSGRLDHILCIRLRPQNLGWVFPDVKYNEDATLNKL